MTATDSPPSIAAPKVSAESAFESPTESIRIIRPRAWIALIACLALAAASILWASLAQVPISATTPGAMLVNGAMVSSTSPVSGRIGEIKVEVEDQVAQGQTLATVTGDDGKIVPVKAAIDGWVVSSVGISGTQIQAGGPLFTLAYESGPLIMRTFPDPVIAQQLQVGSEVIIEMVGAGGVRGTFTSQVSEIGEPITAQQAYNMVGDPALTELVIGQQPVVSPVSVVVDPDQAFPELEEQGFPLDEEAGGSTFLVSATFIIGSKRPIQYVFGSD